MMQGAARLAAALLIPIVGSAPLGQLQEDPSTIWGRLFVDLNSNGAFDEGEPPLGGIPIELANGLRIETTTTAEDGSFSVQVEPGLWRIKLLPPEGFEYTLPEGIELDLVQTTDLPVELLIGLEPVHLLEVLVSSLEVEAEQEELATDQTQESEDEPAPTAEPDVYEGPFLPDDPAADPDLLPESGSRMPPRVAAVVLSGGLFGLGLLAWTIGRVLESGGRRSGRTNP